MKNFENKDLYIEGSNYNLTLLEQAELKNDCRFDSYKFSDLKLNIGIYSKEQIELWLRFIDTGAEIFDRDTVFENLRQYLIQDCKLWISNWGKDKFAITEYYTNLE